MIINWPSFLAALALLLVPITLFHGEKVRFRGIAHEWRNIWPRFFALGLHSIDLCRAALGGWLLVTSLTRNHPTGLAKYAIPATLAAVLFTAVFLQTVFRAKRDTAHACFPFVIGLIFGLYAPAIAAYAVLLALVTALGTHTPAAFFPTLAVALLAVGYLFGGQGMLITLAVGSISAILPWMWSLLTSKELVLSYRARRASEESYPLSDQPT